MVAQQAPARRPGSHRRRPLAPSAIFLLEVSGRALRTSARLRSRRPGRLGLAWVGAEAAAAAVGRQVLDRDAGLGGFAFFLGSASFGLSCSRGRTALQHLWAR